MELTEDDFKKCESISYDLNYVHPKIRLCMDKDNKQLIKEFDCINEEGAIELFNQIMKAWQEVKGET